MVVDLRTVRFNAGMLILALMMQGVSASSGFAQTLPQSQVINASHGTSQPSPHPKQTIVLRSEKGEQPQEEQKVEKNLGASTFQAVQAQLPAPIVSRPDRLSLLAQQLQSPESLSRYMKKNFTYRSDSRNYGKDEFWQSAEEMMEQKVGDCEDYAAFAKAILDRLGFETTIISVYWATNAHTVVVFKTDGKLGYFDLHKLKTSRANSVADLAGDIHGGWDYAALMRQQNRQGVISRKFQGEIAKKTGVEILFKK